MAETFKGRARFAQPALVNGAAGAVWAPGGQPRVVFGFTITRAKIVAIEGRKSMGQPHSGDESLSYQRYELHPIGWVESPLVDRAVAPKQGNEGSPDAWLAFDARFSEGLRDLQVGDEVIVLTWLDRAQRDVLVVHPRGDSANPQQGVFNTRSPDRPNPIGLHRVRILAIQGLRIQVRDLEALDRTPIVDLKPVLDRALER